MRRETHIIDATGKALGRLAAQIAVLLRGKQKPNFLPYKDMGDFVLVKNIHNLKLTGKKIEKEKYFRHTGYLGGLKEISLKKVFKEDPSKVLRMAVFRMLPKNKLRAKQIKRLRIE